MDTVNSENTYNIGIDFGASSCQVAVYTNDKVSAIPLDDDDTSIPACVYFGDNSILVGREAVLKEQTEPKRVVRGIKRILGLLYDDPEFQRDLPSYQFETRRSDRGNIEIVVNGTVYTPTTVAAYIIAHLVLRASENLRGRITEAYISVPAFYNNVQRNDTIYAGYIAGLERVHLVSEPLATSIAYGTIRQMRKDMLMVFDFGGGKLDIQVIQLMNNEYTVMSSMGDHHMGGNDLTENLFQEVVKAYNGMYSEDLSKSYEDYSRLYQAVEDAKIALSTTDHYEIDEEDLLGHDFIYEVTRRDFEHANRGVFARCRQLVEECLEAGRLLQSDITHVYLTGGSSNVPYIQSMLQEIFGDRVVVSTDTNYMVAFGAAIMAGVSMDVAEKGFDMQISMYTTTRNRGNDTLTQSPLRINDMTAMDLGVRVSSGKLSVIIPRLVDIRSRITKRYRAHKDNQKYFSIRVYQGNDELAAKCKLISEVRLDIANRGRAEDTMLDITFQLDSNLTLSVSAIEVSTGNSVEKVVDMGSQAMTENEMAVMRSTLQQTMIQSEQDQQVALKKDAFIKLLNYYQRYLETCPDDEVTTQRKAMLQEYRNWVESPYLATTLEELEEKEDWLKRQMSDSN